MNKKKEQPDRVAEPLQTYTSAKWMKHRKPDPNVLREMEKFRRRHAHHRTDGKSIVELVREERDR